MPFTSHFLEQYLNGPGRGNKYVTLAPKLICEGPDHVSSLFDEIVSAGGEGIILRDPNAPFTPGRSQSYLKYKVNGDTCPSLLTFSTKKFRDAEAKIVKEVGPQQWLCML